MRTGIEAEIGEAAVVWSQTVMHHAENRAAPPSKLRAEDRGTILQAATIIAPPAGYNGMRSVNPMTPS